jgi:signal transduction histidine kinase
MMQQAGRAMGNQEEADRSEMIPQQAAWGWIWGALTGLMLAAALVLCLIDARVPLLVKMAAAAGSCLWAAWYWFFVAQDSAWQQRRWAQGLGFLLSVILMAALSWVHIAFTLLLFAYLGIAFGALPVQWAIPVVVSASLALGFRFMRAGDVHSPRRDLPMLAGFIGIALMDSLLGVFISSIVRQNAERRKMIVELNAARSELAKAEREAGALEERQRLAGEIHDTIAQGLASIVLQLQGAEQELAEDPRAARARISTAIATAREGLAEARRTLWALRPDLLSGEPFHRTVERVMKDWAESSGVPAHSRVTGPVRALSRDVEQMLLRCLQEALANVQKHARAGSVTVTLSYMDNELMLDIRDDGRGFDITKRAPGFGLQGMKERAEALGGRLDMESAPGEGTTIAVQVPLGPPAAAGGIA